MRIGLITPPWVPIPPPAYGGTEVMIDDLARALQARGHHVTLFTIGGIHLPGDPGDLFEYAPEPMGTSPEEAAHVLAAYEALTDVDVIPRVAPTASPSQRSSTTAST